MDERLERYAELAVRVGANVQPGQEVFVKGLVEHAELIRALTRQSYRAGASYVNVVYDDQHVRRKTIEQTTAGNAQLGTSGNPEPELMADLDGERIAQAIPHETVGIYRQHHRENRINWCGVGA